MLVECTYGPVSTEVMGTTYDFAPDEFGRYVAEVWNPKHIKALISVVHYRVVQRDPDVEAPPLALTALEPSSAFIGSDDVVMVCTGTGFTFNSVIVFNGGDEVTQFISDTQVSTIVKPSLAGTPGVYPVFVRDDVGQTEQLEFEFLAVGARAAPEGEEDDSEPQSEGEEMIPVTEITGIGPSIEAKLVDAGITDARQIAALSEDEAAELDVQLGLNGRIARDKWVEQAKALTA